MHAVITGARAAELTDPLPDFGPDPAKHTWRCLAVDKVRYVGEGVAVVVADSRYLAEDALGAHRRRVRAAARGRRPGARARATVRRSCTRRWARNCAYERTFDFGEVDRDFAEADVIVTDRLRWRRSGGQPLETVGAVADFDHATGELTVHTNSLSLHQLPVHGGGHHEDPGEQARHPPGARRAAASARSCSPPSRP